MANSLYLQKALDINDTIYRIYEAARGGTMNVYHVFKYVLLVMPVICRLRIADYRTLCCQSNKFNIRGEPNTTAEMIELLSIRDPLCWTGFSWCRLWSNRTGANANRLHMIEYKNCSQMKRR